MDLSNLLIKLTTPLGPSTPQTLMFESMTATEELGRLFSMDITALSEKPDLDPHELLGKDISVQLEVQDGSPRHLHGHVSSFSLVGVSGNFFQYRIQAQPWLMFLTRRANCRIFQEMSVKDIIEAIFNDYPQVPKFEFRLQGSPSPWEYCVQYRETDFNFISRLMEQEGIYYFFEHTEDGHTLVLVDSVDAHPPCPGGYDKVPFILAGSAAALVIEQEYINEWRLVQTLQPGATTVRDYDFKKSKTLLEGKLTEGGAPFGGDKEFFDYPGDFLTPSEGQTYARVRLEELQSQFHRVLGGGNARGLLCGHTFELTDYPRGDQNTKHLIIATHLHCSMSAYEAGGGQTTLVKVAFTAAPASVPFRPARLTPKTFVQGPQTAVVVGPAGEEIYCDEFGRVKVQFFWDREGKKDDKSSCWIRVSHPWAGKGWGAIHIPRIGQEVIVDFLEGDPDKPIITGRVYNDDQTVPYGLPAQKVVSGVKTQTHKGGGYNEMSMDDTAGSEKITVHAQFDMNTTVEHDDTQTVHNNRTIKVDGTHTETVTGNTSVTIESGTYNHDVAGNTATYHVSGDLTENYDANQSSTIGSNQTNTIGADQSTSIGANRSTEVGSNDSLSVASNMEVSAGANLKVDAGANADYTVGAAHTLSVGSTSEITANGKLTITVGGSTIEMTPASIKISCGASSIELTPASVAVTAPMISLNG